MDFSEHDFLFHDKISHHDNDGKQSCASAHHEEAVNEPGRPDDPVSDPTGLKGLLQA